MKRYLLFITLLIIEQKLYALDHCEVIGKHGPMVYVYCPPTMEIVDVTTVIKSYADLHFDKQKNQVHIDVFDEKSKTPKDYKQLKTLPEKWLNKHRIANYSINKNSNYFSYICKKDKKTSLVDCKDLANK